MAALSNQQCRRDAVALDTDEQTRLLSQLHHDWQLQAGTLQRRFEFSNYYQTLAFINAVAQVAHKQDHHPDICFGYRQCDIHYRTHSADGITLNDFICAAKIDLIDAL